jgi:hypothetical protein
MSYCGSVHHHRRHRSGSHSRSRSRSHSPNLLAPCLPNLLDPCSYSSSHHIDGADLCERSVTQCKMACGSVGSNQIEADAVETVHIANLAITTEKLNKDAVTSEKVSPLLMKRFEKTYTATQFKAFFTTPLKMIDAIDDGIIRIQDIYVRQISGEADYEDGGALTFVYAPDKDTAVTRIAGTNYRASESVPAASIQAAITTDRIFHLSGVLASATESTPQDVDDIQGDHIFIGVKTDEFTAGDSTFKVVAFYSCI